MRWAGCQQDALEDPAGLSAFPANVQQSAWPRGDWSQSRNWQAIAQTHLYYLQEVSLGSASAHESQRAGIQPAVHPQMALVLCQCQHHPARGCRACLWMPQAEAAGRHVAETPEPPRSAASLPVAGVPAMHAPWEGLCQADTSLTVAAAAVAVAGSDDVHLVVLLLSPESGPAQGNGALLEDAPVWGIEPHKGCAHASAICNLCFVAICQIRSRSGGCSEYRCAKEKAS